MRKVCGLDVHKDSVFVCILNEKGVVFQEKFDVLTPELERMVGVMLEHGVTEVGMESTSVYWMPVWRVIDPYVEQKLVNPYFIRQVPIPSNERLFQKLLKKNLLFTNGYNVINVDNYKLKLYNNPSKHDEKMCVTSSTQYWSSLRNLTS